MDFEVSRADASDGAVIPTAGYSGAEHSVHRHIAALVADDALLPSATGEEWRRSVPELQRVFEMVCRRR